MARPGRAFALHSEIVTPYLLHYGTEDQKREWLPRMVRGEVIAAIAMTEPAAGSDLQGMKTTARLDGNHFVLNGQKVFITNGYTADLVVTAAKTDPVRGRQGDQPDPCPRRHNAGFERGRNLEKIGWHAQDTAELFYTDVPVFPRPTCWAPRAAALCNLSSNCRRSA